MINLCEAKYNQLSGMHQCDCGKSHNFETHCCLEHGAFRKMSQFLSNVTPLLSRIALFYDNEELMNMILGNIKRDYRVITVEVTGDKKSTQQITLPEDTKLIVAIGTTTAINSAKYKAYIDDLPVVIAALPEFSALTQYCIMNDEGVYLSYVVNKPMAYIFDLDYQLSPCEKASLFGSIAARLNSSFEYYASALLGDGEYCPYISGAMADIAAKTILKCADADKTSPAINDLLIEESLKLALIAELDIFQRGGEVQCGLTYALLNASRYSQGELQFIFAAVLSMLYVSHIKVRKSFTPPPDNNYRLEQIAELLEIGEHRALALIRPQMSGKAAAIAEYKIKEYTSDLLEKLNKNKNLYKLAFKTFKRLYSDDGYSLCDLVSGDISLCIALSPDIIQGEGMLTALKRLGELDRYIV